MIQVWRNTVAVAAIAAVVLLAGLGSSRLWDEDEPKNATCGQEMLNRGDWIVPTFNDELRTDKPILIYWCMIAVYHVLGVSEFAARLPSALAGIGTVVLTFQLGRLMFNVRTGFVASLLIASALSFAVLARAATPDSLLIFCITASITSFVAGVAARRNGHFSGKRPEPPGQPIPVYEHGLPILACVGIYLAMGLAVLAKGPIGVVMPLGIIGSYLLFFDGVAPSPNGSNRLTRFARFFAPSRIFCVARTLRLAWGLALVAIVALPWYIFVATRTQGEWIAGFIGKHNVGRFMQPMEHHHGLPIYYLVAILIGFFPASVFLPAAVWQSITTVRRNDAERASFAFLLCWIGCYVGFFTLAATKLPNYVVPCYPALAVATAAWLSMIMDRAASQAASPSRIWQLWAGYGAFVVASICATIGIAIAARVLLKVDASIAIPGVVAVVGGIACLILLYRSQVQWSVAAFAVTGLAFTSWAMIYTSPRISRQEEGPHLAQRIQQLAGSTSQGEPRVASYRYFTPTLVYYLGHPVTRLQDGQEIAQFFERGGDALVLPRKVYDQQHDELPKNLTVVAEQKRFLRSERVVLLSRNPKVARAEGREQSR